MTDNHLDIEVRADGPRVTLALAGELDIVTAPTLRACLESIDNGFRQVVLDLTDVTFLDSTGLALMIEVHRRFRPEGRDLALSNPRSHVARVIDLTGVAEVLPVTGDASPLPRR